MDANLNDLRATDSNFTFFDDGTLFSSHTVNSLSLGETKNDFDHNSNR